MDIRHVDDSHLLEACRLTVPSLPGTDRAALEEIEAAPRELGIDLRRQIIAVEGGSVCGACLYVLGAGRGATVLKPALAVDHASAHAVGVELIRRARKACGEAGAILIQAILDEGPEQEDGRRFLAAGFAPLAVLEYLEVSVRKARNVPLDDAWQFQPYSSNLEEEFRDVIAATYQGSLDCPALDGLRTPADVLESHKGAGIFTPEGWMLTRRGDTAVGVVLVNRVFGRPACELVYMGVIPAFRHQGLGRGLVQKAIEIARRLGRSIVTVAVDAGNTPARQLYRDAGFKVTATRHAYYAPADGR